jgi:hypothetical protein
MLKFPHFLDNWLTEGDEVVGLMHWQATGIFLVLISVRG